MIRQELMDNVEQLTDVLNGALSINPPADVKNCINDALKVAMDIADLVSKELEAQRQEQLDYIPFDEVSEADVDSVINLLKEADEEIKMGIGVYDTEETKEFKRWCYHNNRSFNNGQVLNEYMKERGV